MLFRHVAELGHAGMQIATIRAHVLTIRAPPHGRAPQRATASFDTRNEWFRDQLPWHHNPGTNKWTGTASKVTGRRSRVRSKISGATSKTMTLLPSTACVISLKVKSRNATA